MLVPQGKLRSKGSCFLTHMRRPGGGGGGGGLKIRGIFEKGIYGVQGFPEIRGTVLGLPKEKCIAFGGPICSPCIVGKIPCVEHTYIYICRRTYTATLAGEFMKGIELADVRLGG